MKLSRATVAVMPPPMISLIWATNCEPMTFTINFPAIFSEQDRDHVHEFLKQIYEEVTDREDS